MPVAEMLAKRPAAVILSGGPASVYADGAPSVDPALFDAGVPALGICYGFQAMAEALGGTVKRTEGAEFGRTTATVEPDAVLFAGQPAKQPVWMSHRDAVVVAPPGFAVTGRTDGAEIAAFEHPERRLFGMQWHPEVMHTAHGQTMLERFLYDGAGIAPSWTTANIIDDAIADDPRRASATVTCSAGSPVGSTPRSPPRSVHRAVGDQLTCVFVDHGLLRKGEREQVERDYVAATGIRLVVVDASEKFLTALARRHRPGAEAQDHRHRVHPHVRGGRGARSSPPSGARRRRVPGAGHALSRRRGVRRRHRHRQHQEPPQRRRPARRPAVRAHRAVEGAVQGRGPRGRASSSGCPSRWCGASRSRGPGSRSASWARSTRERLATVREADAIAREELEAAGLERDVWQFPVVLLADVRSVGVQGDGRTYAHPIVLRPITSEDAMTADWARLPTEVLERISTRITNEVRGRQPGRARHLEQAARDHRVGVTARVSRRARRALTPRPRSRGWRRSRRRRPGGRSH